MFFLSKCSLVLLLSCQLLVCQNYKGIIVNSKNGNPIEYVNVGVIKKNIGTVSDNKGKYSINLVAEFDNDTLMFSCIGYQPYLIKVSEFKNLGQKDILLDERIFELNEVIVRPKVFKHKILGVTANLKSINAGFKENQLGYECGVMLKIKKSAILERLDINIASCSYDTVFYRINIYKVKGDMNFTNILEHPIYLKLATDEVKDKIEFDLKKYNIKLQGDCLITLEHVKNIGSGSLLFCASLGNKTYFRKTSQGIWETAPAGISISVDAKVEK
jgi:hypothetical protein